jgi:four helix bundle protein
MERNEERAKDYQTFEDLEVYQVAREFRRAMYQVAKQLPDLEKFGLVTQVRRAAVSLTNNIAEGHGRYHFLDQIKFMLQSRGSLEELLDDLNVCEDEKYLAMSEIDRLKEAGWCVHKLLNGYIRFLRSRTGDKAARLQESPDEELSADDLGDVIRFNPSSL